MDDSEAKATAKTPPVKKEKVEQPKQNGITRPKTETITGSVWEIADKVSADEKAPAPRSVVLKICGARGINPATAATQYGKWRKFNGLKGTGRVPKAKPDLDSTLGKTDTPQTGPVVEKVVGA